MEICLAEELAHTQNCRQQLWENTVHLK
jgi:hypothetical protein